MKRIARILGIVVVVLLGIAIALPFLIDANQFRPALESRLTAALRREVKLGDLKVSLFSGGVSASDLSVADDPSFSQKPFLRAQSLKVRVEILPLILSRKLNVTGVTIDQPQIDVIETPAGVFNFSSIGAKSGAVAVRGIVAQLKNRGATGAEGNGAGAAEGQSFMVHHGSERSRV